MLIFVGLYSTVSSLKNYAIWSLSYPSLSVLIVCGINVSTCTGKLYPKFLVLIGRRKLTIGNGAGWENNKPQLHLGPSRVAQAIKSKQRT